MSNNACETSLKPPVCALVLASFLNRTAKIILFFDVFRIVPNFSKFFRVISHILLIECQQSTSQQKVQDYSLIRQTTEKSNNPTIQHLVVFDGTKIQQKNINIILYIIIYNIILNIYWIKLLGNSIYQLLDCWIVGFSNFVGQLTLLLIM